jgi:hypothetical protein
VLLIVRVYSTLYVPVHVLTAHPFVLLTLIFGDTTGASGISNSTHALSDQPVHADDQFTTIAVFGIVAISHVFDVPLQRFALGALSIGIVYVTV